MQTNSLKNIAVFAGLRDVKDRVPLCFKDVYTDRNQKKMAKRERNEIIKQAESLTYKELEEETIDALYDCLGSQTKEMYEKDYFIEDQRKEKNINIVIKNIRRIL